MKKLGMTNLKLSFLFILVATVVLLSCQQHTVVLHSQEGGKDKAVAEDSGAIAITVTNFVNQISRTVAPDQLTEANLSPADYKLRLTGTNSRMSLPEQELTLTNGKVTVRNVPEGLWELTLQATSVRGGNGVNANDPILQAKATAQVSNGSITPVTFTLRPVEAGSGTLQLTVNFDQENLNNLIADRDIQKTYIKLCDKNNALVPNHPTNAVIDGRFSTPSFKFPTNSTLSLSAGEYELRVEFMLYNEVSAVWKEDVVIETGRHTSGTVTVPHILKNPAAASWATSAISPISTEDNGLFEATLNWNPATNDFNTTSYEIQLKKLPTTATLTTNVQNDGAWNNVQGDGDTIIITGDPNSPHHFSNYMGTYPVALAEGITTFDRRTSSLKLLLAAGQYVYRLRSIGHSGQQRWTYGNNSKILMPLPSTPTLPTNYYTVRGSAGGNDYHVTINWNAAANATQYEIQTLRFDNNSRPAIADLPQYHSDTAFSSSDAGGADTENTNSKPWQFDERNAYLVRLRAKNPVGTSPWFYFPYLLNRSGPVVR